MLLKKIPKCISQRMKRLEKNNQKINLKNKLPTPLFIKPLQAAFAKERNQKIRGISIAKNVKRSFILCVLIYRTMPSRGQMLKRYVLNALFKIQTQCIK